MKALCAAVIAIVLAGTAAAIDGFATPPAAAPSRVGPVLLLDVNYIVDHSRRFEQLAAGLKREMQVAGEQLQREGEFGNSLYERMKDYPPGTPDYKSLEQDVLQRRADFQLRWSRRHDDFSLRKSKLLYSAYCEAQDEARRLAQRDGAALVLQFDSQPIDSSSSESIMRGLDNCVVYQRGLDLTPVVLDTLNRRVPSNGVVDGQTTTSQQSGVSANGAAPNGALPPSNRPPVRSAQRDAAPAYNRPSDGAYRSDGTVDPTAGPRSGLPR